MTSLTSGSFSSKKWEWKLAGLETFFQGSWIKIKYLLSGDVLPANVICHVNLLFNWHLALITLCFQSQLENLHCFRFWRKQIARACAEKCGELWRNSWMVRWWRHGRLTVNRGWRAQMRVMMVRRHVMSSVVVMLLVISGGKMVQRRFAERRTVVVVAATHVTVWL